MSESPFVRAQMDAMDRAYARMSADYSRGCWDPGRPLTELPASTRWQRLQWRISGIKQTARDLWRVAFRGYEARHPLDD